MMKSPFVVIYFLMAVGIGVIGYIDIVTAFRPIGSSFIFFAIVFAWSMRGMVAKYLPRVKVSNECILIGFVCVFLNFCGGIYLNYQVAEQANAAIAAIEKFHSEKGNYPGSLLDAASTDNRRTWSDSRIKFGAHYYYLRTGQSFAFGFETFPFGGKSWDGVKRQFQDSMD